MRTRLVLTTGLAAVSLLALAACGTGTGGSDGSGGTGGTGSSGAGASIGDCLQGTWILDAERNATQIQEYLTANGTPITSTEVTGGVTLTVDGDGMTYDSDITYRMVAQLDGGLELAVVQNQAGVSTGDWAEDAGEVVYSNWTNGIVVTNEVTIAGESASIPIEIPADTGAGVAMETTCSDAELTTHAVESPFTNYWSRG